MSFCSNFLQNFFTAFEKPRAVITEEIESNEQDDRIGGNVQLSTLGGSSNHNTRSGDKSILIYLRKKMRYFCKCLLKLINYV